MAVSYKKLFKLLIDRDMKKKDFKELTGISQGTLNKLQNGGNVMVDVLEKICLNMDCGIDDIMEIYPAFFRCGFLIVLNPHGHHYDFLQQECNFWAILPH